jgi:hypothetical protein
LVGDSWLSIDFVNEGCAMSFKEFDVRAKELASQQDVRGMTFFEFIRARFADHALGWFGVSIIAFLAYFSFVTYIDANERGVLEFLLCLAGIVVLLVILLTVFIFVGLMVFGNDDFIDFIVMMSIVVLGPFAFISICIEALWRIWSHRPYIVIAPPSLPDLPISTFEYQEPAPRPHGRDWVFPLVIGLFLGHMWGHDD